MAAVCGRRRGRAVALFGMAGTCGSRDSLPPRLAGELGKSVCVCGERIRLGQGVGTAEGLGIPPKNVQICRSHTYVAVAIELWTGRLWWDDWRPRRAKEGLASGEPGRKNPASTAGFGMGLRATLVRRCRLWSASSKSCAEGLRDEHIPHCKSRQDALEPILKGWLADLQRSAA